MDETSMEALRVQARRAYERGRWRRAAPWALWPLGLAGLGMLIGCCPAPHAITLGCVLAPLVVWARVRGQEWGSTAARGLAGGTAAFALAWMGIGVCAADGCDTSAVTSLVCGSVGLGVGLVIGTRVGSLQAVAATVAFAATMGTLGCASAGVAAALGLGLAMLGGAVTGLLWGRASAS